MLVSSTSPCSPSPAYLPACLPLHPQIQRLLSGSAEGPAVVQLLDELLACATERCLEPLLLEPSVLDRILGQWSVRQSAATAQQPQLSLL